MTHVNHRTTDIHHLPSLNKKRSFIIHGHKTSATLEDEFYEAAKFVARFMGVTLRAYLERIENERRQSNLSSAIRLRVLADVQAIARLARAEVGMTQ